MSRVHPCNLGVQDDTVKRVGLLFRRHRPRRRTIPVCRDVTAQSLAPRRTGYPAFARYDDQCAGY